MKCIMLLYGVSMLVIGHAMKMDDLSKRRHESRMLNPFHFEDVTNGLLHYIQVKSKIMLGKCKIVPTEMPNLFICLKNKYVENKDVQSADPKIKFIGMMRLMNTSAECFKNVSQEQGLCLWENKNEMVKYVNSKAQSLGKILDQILGACKATSDMVSCVDAKKTKLQELAKTMLTNPDNAENIWDLGASFKTCLTDETIKQCVLSKKDGSKEWPGKDRYGGMDMKKHIIEKSMKMFGECNLTPKNSPAVFMCLKKKFDESKMKTLKEPKEMFITGMMLMNTSALCFKNATNEQKSCLLNKKKEMHEKLLEASEKIQKVMDKVLLSCGVNETETPDLLECIQPKREKMMKMMPDLLNNPAMAEPVWDLAEEAKKCFESKPEIGKCIKKKNMDYFMKKFGNMKESIPVMAIMVKVKMMLKKCNISAQSTPTIYSCMQTKVESLKSLMRSKDLTPAEKFAEFSKLRKEGLKCLQTDDKRKECVRESSLSLIKGVTKKFRVPTGKFDVDTVMKRMDAMLAGCGITSKKTPGLKSCLDERTDAVMKIKPWIPMDNEAREKLKAEGVKYWKCFDDGQGEELKCMKKIVDGFKTQGKAFSARMEKISDTVEEKINDLIGNVSDKVLACSPNKCFSDHVKEVFESVKPYWKYMKESKKEELKDVRKKMFKSLFQGMFCLQEIPSFERAKTFSCIQPIINQTSSMIKGMLQKWKQGASMRWDKPWGKKRRKN